MTSLLLHVDIVQLKDYRWCFPSQFCCSSPHIFSGEWSNLTHKWSNGLVQPATRRVVLEFNKAGYIIYIYLHIIHMCIFLNNYHTMPGAWFMNTVCSFPAFEPWLMQRRKHIPPNACIYIYICIFCWDYCIYLFCSLSKEEAIFKWPNISIHFRLPSFFEFQLLKLEIFQNTHISITSQLKRPLEAHGKTQQKEDRKGGLPIPSAAMV